MQLKLQKPCWNNEAALGMEAKVQGNKTDTEKLPGSWMTIKAPYKSLFAFLQIFHINFNKCL